jgi:hypothetical protein
MHISDGISVKFTKTYSVPGVRPVINTGKGISINLMVRAWYGLPSALIYPVGWVLIFGVVLGVIYLMEY